MNITLNETKITQDSRNLAFEKNSGVDEIVVTVDTDESWIYKLDIRYPDKYAENDALYNIIDLDRNGSICSVTLTSEMLPFNGKYTMQLRGISGDKVYHSDTFEAWVKYSIEPGSTYNPIPSEFYQIETKLDDKANEAKQYAENAETASTRMPKISSDKTWLIWDVGTGGYVDTGLPSAGENGVGIQSIEYIGIDEQGNNVYKINLTNGQNYNFVALKGEKGDPFHYEDFTEAQLEALRGPQGLPGKDGKDGVDGKAGRDGVDGAPGKDGYTPQKGIDYFDGAPGKDGSDGAPGRDGYTPQKGIDYFDGAPGRDGYTPQKGIDYFDGAPGRDGRDGANGSDGHTPVKGTDYFTEEEVAEIEQSAARKVNVPVKDVQINGTSAVVDGIANIPYASDKYAGIIFIKGRSGSGMEIGSDGVLKAYSADTATISSRGSSRMQLSPSNLDYAVKAAMCDGKGAAWTAEEQAAACNRVGAIRSYGDGWILKARWQNSNPITVDFSGCSEFFIAGYINATGDSDLLTNINSNKICYQFARNGERNIRMLFCNQPIGGIMPLLGKWSSSAEIQGDNLTVYSVGKIGSTKKISDITTFSMSKSEVVTSMDIYVYAR